MWGLSGVLSSRKPSVYLISLLESAASRRIAVPRRFIYRETATRKIIRLIENIFRILIFLFKPKTEFMAARFDCEKNDSVRTWNRRSAEKGIRLCFVPYFMIDFYLFFSDWNNFWTWLLRIIMWVLGVGLSWGDLRWRSVALLPIFWNPFSPGGVSPVCQSKKRRKKLLNCSLAPNNTSDQRLQTGGRRFGLISTFIRRCL